MKLIVLYGPEDSGKTTTLKMVYDELKKINLFETNQFRYVDKEPRGTTSFINVDVCRLDFRDILYILPFCGTNYNMSQKNQPSQKYNDLMIFESKDLKKYIEIADKTIQLYRDMSESDQDSIVDLNEDLSFTNNVNDVLSADKYISKVNTVDLNSVKTVGIVTQGDYGYLCKTKAKNLYKLLDELKKCDTIVCACSAGNPSKPIDCVLNFVRDNKRSITSIVFVIALPFRPHESKNTKTPKELRRARIILLYI